MGYYSNRTRIEKLFDQLCVDLGYCFSSEEHTRIQKKLPLSIDDFTDEVLIAEGLDPQINKQLRKGVRNCVAYWFESEVAIESE